MPRTCLVCGSVLGTSEKHLCLHCASGLPLTYNWERTHNPMAEAYNAALERLREDGEHMDYAYASALLFYHHENPYKAIPQALKYNGNIKAGRYFSAMLGRFMASQPHFADIDAVIPVPLHWARKWMRGYNQADIIAGELAKALGAELFPRALKRMRRTKSQTSLSAEQRQKNVAGVFQAGRLPLSARHILLVDDTFTTGATLSACQIAIRKALGPSVRISIATLAVVED